MLFAMLLVVGSMEEDKSAPQQQHRASADEQLIKAMNQHLGSRSDDGTPVELGAADEQKARSKFSFRMIKHYLALEMHHKQLVVFEENAKKRADMLKIKKKE